MVLLTCFLSRTQVIDIFGANQYLVMSFPVTANKIYVVGCFGSKLMLRGINYTVATAVSAVKSDKESFTFRNPAKGNLVVSIDRSAQIGIYNTVGKLVKQQLLSPSENAVNISDLAQGVYFVRDLENIYKATKLIVE